MEAGSEKKTLTTTAPTAAPSTEAAASTLPEPVKAVATAAVQAATAMQQGVASAHVAGAVQVVWVVRHGDRMDSFDPNWRKTAKHHEDTPLSPLGHAQAIEVANCINSSGHPVRHILSSPFLRAIQTALPLSQLINVPIKLEGAVWETGCRRPPPPHTGFPVDESYQSSFLPTCGERPADFRPRLARAAGCILQRFPFESGNIAIFSHADPVAYLVCELSGVDPSLIGPVTVCSIFRLERGPTDPKFKLVRNSDIAHLSMFGNTEPCHPIHAFHDWCSLFTQMREQGLVESTFRWPPKSEDMEKLKQAWKTRYQTILEDGKMPERKSQSKVKFDCPRCSVVSYISRDLFFSAPPTHKIKCWKCKVKFRLTEISSESLVQDP